MSNGTLQPFNVPGIPFPILFPVVPGSPYPKKPSGRALPRWMFFRDVDYDNYRGNRDSYWDKIEDWFDELKLWNPWGFPSGESAGRRTSSRSAYA